MFVVKAHKSSLILTDSEPLYAYAKNVYHIQFVFSEEWRELDITATFSVGTQSYQVDLTYNRDVKIPWELLAFDDAVGQKLTVSMVGKWKDHIVLPSGTVTLGTIRQGSVMDGEHYEPPAPPTPDVYDQLLTAIRGKADDLVLEGQLLRLKSGEEVLATVILPESSGGSGSAGADGKDGKDATINGVNTLEIVEGENISIRQNGSTLTISATIPASDKAPSTNWGDIVGKPEDLVTEQALTTAMEQMDEDLKSYVAGVQQVLQQEIETIQLTPGPKGEQGEPGKNATINGVNVLTLEVTGKATMTQTGGTVTIDVPAASVSWDEIFGKPSLVTQDAYDSGMEAVNKRIDTLEDALTDGDGSGAGGDTGVSASSIDDTLKIGADNKLGVRMPVRELTQSQYDALPDKSGLCFVSSEGEMTIYLNGAELSLGSDTAPVGIPTVPIMRANYEALSDNAKMAEIMYLIYEEGEI